MDNRILATWRTVAQAPWRQAILPVKPPG